jgi:microcystin-dependent protein
MDGILGEIRPFAGTFAPQFWALCDGSTLSITEYTALFALLSTTYGGDGKTNFGLPNLCGRVIVKDGQGTGLSAYTLASQGGQESVAIATATFPAHSHTFMVTNTPATTNAVTANSNFLAAMVDSGNPGNTVKSYLPGGATGEVTVELSNGIVSTAPGGNSTHENRMPYMPINYIICTQGIYPQFQ